MTNVYQGTSESEEMEAVESDHSRADESRSSSDVIHKADSLDSLVFDGIEEKKFKRGVVYVSYIPEGMHPTMLRELMFKFAPIGRIFMQRVQEPGARKRKKKKGGGAWAAPEKYSEGWIEFLKKRHAKQVAALLNNQPMGSRKKDKFHDCLWNLKYLSNFKWIHLVERLNYEKAVIKQRMQNEISQAKRVANFFKDTVDKEEKQRKMNKKGIKFDDKTQSPYTFSQRESLEEKSKKKIQKQGINTERQQFLKSLFS